MNKNLFISYNGIMEVENSEIKNIEELKKQYTKIIDLGLFWACILKSRSIRIYFKENLK